jgi:hypothetical protein
MYEAPGLAIILNILFFILHLSMSFLKKLMNCCFVILPDLFASILSKMVFLKNFGKPHTSTVRLSNSSSFTSFFPFENAFSIPSSIYLTYSFSKGLPSGK